MYMYMCIYMLYTQYMYMYMYMYMCTFKTCQILLLYTACDCYYNICYVTLMELEESAVSSVYRYMYMYLLGMI